MITAFWILIGLFYLFAAVLAAKAHLAGAIMDTMIRAIEARAIKPAESWRLIWLLLGAFWVGLAGLLALLRLQGVAALFVFSFMWQALYLLFLAPRYFDQVDEPDPSGRAQTKRAFMAYGVVTVAVLWASNQAGTLETWMAAERWKCWVTVVAALGSLSVLGFKAWRAVYWPGAGVSDASSSTPASNNDRLSHASASGDPSQGGPSQGDHLEDAPDAEIQLADIAQDDSIQVTLRPSWNDGGLFNTQTGEPIKCPEQRLGITEALHDLVSDWLCLWREHADPADPRRQALLNYESLTLIDAAGQVLAEAIKASLGPERVRFSPHAEPCPPRWQVTGLRLMADYQCNALWFDADDEGVGDIPTEQLGLSWSLARDLDIWALDFDDSYDLVDAGGQRLWTEQQEQAHEREGQALLLRLRRELDATGRASIRLRM